MHSFFTNPASHIGAEGQLHVWAMAKPELRNALEPFARSCDSFDYLGVQMSQDLHATVLRLAPTDGNTAAFIAAFRRECGDLGRLRLPLGWPVPTEDSVICIGEYSRKWEALITATQRASVQAFGKAAAPYDPPFGPHITIAYGIDDGSNAPIAAALRQVRSAYLANTGGAENAFDNADHLHYLDIDSVVLARVYQDRQIGTYTGEILTEVSIRP